MCLCLRHHLLPLFPRADQEEDLWWICRSGPTKIIIMPVIQQIKKYPSRVWKSLALYSSLVTLGLSLGVAGPTMLDLGILVQDDKNIAYILPGRAGGYAVGSFLGLTPLSIILSCPFSLFIYIPSEFSCLKVTCWKVTCLVLNT